MLAHYESVISLNKGLKAGLDQLSEIRKTGDAVAEQFLCFEACALGV